MKEISKREAKEKYGICTSGANSMNRYYLMDDGSVVDDTKCTRYIPALSVNNQALDNIIVSNSAST